MRDKHDATAKKLFKCICEYGRDHGDSDLLGYHDPHCPAHFRKIVADVLRATVATEQERCAKVADLFDLLDKDGVIATAIRTVPEQ